MKKLGVKFVGQVDPSRELGIKATIDKSLTGTYITRFRGTVSQDFPAQTAYITLLKITSFFMDKKDFANI